jgi:hypothetical protein
LYQRTKNDIGEKGMDEEVHGFASNDKSVSAVNEQDKRDTAYPANGWAAKEW